jgi:triosephosphate isomerase
MGQSNLRKPLLVGNWKMHKSVRTAEADFLDIAGRSQAHANALEIGIAPVSLHLSSLTRRRAQDVGVFGQNVHWEAEGAFTGEASAQMLKDVGAKGSLVAHSERRQMNGETNHTAGRKIRALADQGLSIIYCVGETLTQREGGELEQVLTAQLQEAFAAAQLRDLSAFCSHPRTCSFSIAYEPVWAIGTGKAATEKEAQEAHRFIRACLERLTSPAFAQRVRILYGGSVKPANISSFMRQPDIDGALVGGASLDPASFQALCAGAAEAASF